MIFASDLDQTLIYSERFLTEFPGEVVAVEIGKYSSYMTKRASELLKIISSKITFIPCTTRTIEQYNRIQYFRDSIRPNYAVVSNGANILLSGVVDLGYQERLFYQLLNECLASKDVLAEFSKLASKEWAQPMHEADKTFHYCIIDRQKIPLEELKSFGNWVEKQQWTMSIQGRKLYLIPKIVNKGNALRRIMELAGKSEVFSAGDSLLDLPLLWEGKHSISPAHGEIFEQYCDAGWIFTKSSGILAGEEILSEIFHLLEENSP